MMDNQYVYMKENIEAIREKMARAAESAGRKPEEVLLLAACKTRTVEEVKASAELGIDVFGENHVQELVEKVDAGAYLGKPGHLIGHLQTNKIKYVLERADLIQSIDSAHILTALETAAAKKEKMMNVLIELNIGAEASKTGLAADDLWQILELAEEQPHINVKGLMTIPPAATTDLENRRYFEMSRRLFEKAAERHYERVSMEILSMGMSEDYENAIREGSTMVRIGSAIYGPRVYH